MAGLAAPERGIFRPLGPVTAITGPVCAPGMIGHERAHRVAFAASLEIMAAFLGAWHITFALLIHYMMAIAAFYRFMRVMVESDIESWARAIIQ